MAGKSESSLQVNTKRNDSSIVKKHLSFIIKLVLTLGILGWIFHKIDFQKFQLSIKNADWEILIWAILLYFISSFINTYKWSLLLNSHAITHPYRRLVNYNFIGMFCNFFMPGMVGGDVQKCYAVYRDESLDLKDKLPRGRLTQIISSVMMARLTGVVAMIWQANLAYFFVFRKLPFYQGITDPFIIFLLPKILFINASGNYPAFYRSPVFQI